jgi:hypothetical protein
MVKRDRGEMDRGSRKDEMRTEGQKRIEMAGENGENEVKEEKGEKEEKS